MFLHIIVISFAAYFSNVSAIGESFEAEYFTNASLPCDFTKHELTYPNLIFPIKKYWILPNGTVLGDTYIGNNKMYFRRPTAYDFDLVITDIDDPDFGIYHCAILWNNWDYRVDIIKVGLNENGPLYQRQLKQFRINVIIGGSCAGVAFIILLVGCCMCRHREAKKRKENVYKKHGPDADLYDSTRQRTVNSTRLAAVDSSKLTSVYGYDFNKEFDQGCNPGFDDKDVSSVIQRHQDEEVYATVNKQRNALREARHTDVVTMQSAHL